MTLVINRKMKVIMAASVLLLVLNAVALPYWIEVVAGIEPSPDLTVLNSRHIAIDPGHGGIDSGASGNRVVEKDVNLSIALKLAELLKANGAQVTLTREADTDYSTTGRGGKRNDLLKRVEMINQSGADCFISIHVNSIRGSSLSGSQVFYGGQLPSSKLLAETLQLYLKDFPPGNKRQAKKDMDILVLNATDIPGVLIETGFLSNKGEAARLLDAEYQQTMARHITEALAYHLTRNVAR